MQALSFLIKRLALGLALIVLVISAIFFLFRLMPGDYTALMLYQGASQEAVEAFRERWGLNDPLYIQWLRYLRNVALLQFGDSLAHNQSVTAYTGKKIFNSFILVAPGVTVAYIFGVTYGAIAGTNRGTWIEKHGIILIIAVGAVPAFVIAIYLVSIFADTLGVFPTSGMTSASARETIGREWYSQYLTTDFAAHYVLPFTAVVLRYASLPTLLMRTSVQEVLNEEFIAYYRMTGIPKMTRLYRVGRHAILPPMTMYPISLSRALGGLVLIEIVFNWPGIGAALVAAVLGRDFPVIQFIFILIAVWIIVVNTIVDILYGVIDPRISLGDRAS